MTADKEKTSLFREKSMEQFTNPEQLNNYIRVIHPSLILLLAAIISLLVGIIIWGYLGTINSTASCTAYVSSGVIHSYLPFDGDNELSNDSRIVIGETEYDIQSVSSPAPASLVLNEEQLVLYQLNSDDIVIALMAQGALPDGVYQAKVILESIRPISLILG